MLSDIFKIIDWTSCKAKIHESNPVCFPYKREIWWASLGQNVGVEINGKHSRFERPVLVIKVFNLHSILIAPITSRIGDKKHMLSFLNHNNERKSVNISQLRTISTKRLSRKIGKMSVEDFSNVLHVIQIDTLKTETPSNDGVSEESFDKKNQM